MSRIFIYILAWIAILGWLCANNNDIQIHKLTPAQETLTAFEKVASHIQEVKGTQSADSLNRLQSFYHRELMHKFPIVYDWWLQDGDTIAWFTKDFKEQLVLRRAKLQLSASSNNSELELFNEYLDACTKRRTERLSAFVATSPKIVFTKFRTLRPSFYAYTEGLSDARGECNFFGGGELSSFSLTDNWAKEERLIIDSFGVLRDPDIHFDGNNLLFAWKKSAKEDDFHLYEMDLKTKNTTQLTFGLGHADIEGIYLPDENILFNSTRCGTSVDCWVTEVSNMYISDRKGRFMRRVGFDQVHTSNPSVLDDGRVIYTRWDYNDRGQVFTQPLFQMNQDATGQAEYYGLNSWFPTTITHARQIPGTRKTMATILGHHNPQHGKLGIIDPEMGRDENEGVRLVAPMRVPKNERIDSYGQFTDQFQHPYPLTENTFLISYTPLGYYIGHPMDFGIYWMNVDGERELLISDSTNSCNQPVLAMPRTRPFVRSSTVNFEAETGSYYLQDVYEGNGLRGIERGTIKKLRIVEIEFRAASIGFAFCQGEGGGAHAGSPVGVGNASWDLKKVHGTVDVQPDGSALFEVPARTPLYFQALDEKGFVVQTMRSWSTLQPGEMQSCVGCHEHKNSVPVYNHPTSMAMKKGIQKMTPRDSEGVRSFSYIAEVQPIWDKHCIACHNGEKQKMSLKGDMKVIDTQSKRKYSESYLSLTHARQTSQWNPSWQGLAEDKEVNWISCMSVPTLLSPYSGGSATSNIIKRMEKGHGGTKVSQEEISKVALWLDLLVPFISTYREANNWSEEEMEFYGYYEKKRDDAAKEEASNIKQYIESLKR